MVKFWRNRLSHVAGGKAPWDRNLVVFHKFTGTFILYTAIPFPEMYLEDTPLGIIQKIPDITYCIMICNSISKAGPAQGDSETH